MTVRVTLNLLGTHRFRLIEEVMAFDAGALPTLRHLIDRVEERNPGFRAAVLDEAGRLSRQFAFLINGMNAEYAGGLEASLCADDEVNIIPAIAGG